MILSVPSNKPKGPLDKGKPKKKTIATFLSEDHAP